MARFVGLDVSQKLTSICVVDVCRSQALARSVSFRAGTD